MMHGCFADAKGLKSLSIAGVGFPDLRNFTWEGEVIGRDAPRNLQEEAQGAYAIPLSARDCSDSQESVNFEKYTYTRGR